MRVNRSQKKVKAVAFLFQIFENPELSRICREIKQRKFPDIRTNLMSDSDFAKLSEHHHADNF